MSSQKAFLLVVAIDKLVAFVDQHNEIFPGPDRTLTPAQQSLLNELDGAVEALRVKSVCLRGTLRSRNNDVLAIRN